MAIHHVNENVSGWLVGYDDVSRVIYRGGAGEETLTVNQVPLGTSLELHQVNFSSSYAFNVGGGNYAANVLGPISIFGRREVSAMAELTINDQDDVAGLRDLGESAPFGTNPIVGIKDVYVFDEESTSSDAAGFESSDPAGGHRP